MGFTPFSPRRIYADGPHHDLSMEDGDKNDRAHPPTFEQEAKGGGPRGQILPGGGRHDPAVQNPARHPGEFRDEQLFPDVDIRLDAVGAPLVCDGEGFARLEPAAHLVSVHARHPDVEKDQVGQRGSAGFEGQFTGRGRMHFISLIVEHPGTATYISPLISVLRQP